MDTQKLYAIRNETTRHVKIGLAVDPKVRLGALQTGTSSRLKLIVQQNVKTPKAAEKYAHAVFHSHRITGEWFSDAVTTPEIERVFQEASTLEGKAERKERRVPDEAETINLAIREAIKTEMKSRGESVIGLAKRMGVTRAYIYQVINGDRAKVPDSVAKVLEALDLHLEVVENHLAPTTPPEVE